MKRLAVFTFAVLLILSQANSVQAQVKKMKPPGTLTVMVCMEKSGTLISVASSLEGRFDEKGWKVRTECPPNIPMIKNGGDRLTVTCRGSSASISCTDPDWEQKLLKFIH